MVKNKNMARMGKSNGRWKGGNSSGYLRRIKNAKKGELIHHKDGNKSNSSKSNLGKLKPSKGITAIGKHNKKHPEKGRKKKKK